MQPKIAKKQPPKSGLGDRQVGAFSVFGAGHTGGPFIFRPKSPFFRKICRFRGWCNTTPSVCREQGILRYVLSAVCWVWVSVRVSA